MLTLAVNIPGPVAAARLCELGATVVKVEPPGGDPLSRISPVWYEALIRDQKILRLNLKQSHERAQLDHLLEASDLLITATRSSALDRLSLGWEQIHERFPRLSHVAIAGYPPPNEEKAGHDATYQAELGLLAPPDLPRILLADSAGADRVVSVAVTLLFARERNGDDAYARVHLSKRLASSPSHCDMALRLTAARLVGRCRVTTSIAHSTAGLLSSHLNRAFGKDFNMSFASVSRLRKNCLVSFSVAEHWIGRSGLWREISPLLRCLRRVLRAAARLSRKSPGVGQLIKWS